MQDADLVSFCFLIMLQENHYLSKNTIEYLENIKNQEKSLQSLNL